MIDSSFIDSFAAFVITVELLRESVKALGHWQDDFEAIVSEDLMSNLIGAFEMNNIGMRMKSPLQIYLDAARAAGGDAAVEAEAYVQEIGEGADDDDDEDDDEDEDEDAEDGGGDTKNEDADGGGTGKDEAGKDEEAGNPHGAKRPCRRDTEEEHEGKGCGDASCGDGSCTRGDEEEEEKLGFFDGTGLYSLACMMNHSCEPNIRVLYPEDGKGRGEARMVAMRPIKEGDELQISYIEESWPRSRRQEELEKGYGFTCVCSKCRRQED